MNLRHHTTYKYRWSPRILRKKAERGLSEGQVWACDCGFYLTMNQSQQ